MRKPYPGNNYCPCGSNKKYKGCCQLRGVDYFLKPGGKVVAEQALVGDDRRQFEANKQEFQELQGRKPTEEEEGLMRLHGFSDLAQVIESDLVLSGAAPEVIYAYRQTGILVSRENVSQISAEELSAWESAIDEYRRNQEN